MEPTIDDLIQEQEDKIAGAKALIKEHEEMQKVLTSRAGKAIFKELADAKESASKLTISANETMRNQGILGVQAVTWVNDHFNNLGREIYAAYDVIEMAELEIKILKDGNSQTAYEA
ncbi:hypothetical protein pVco7_gp119 [Vibrio phage pVco-7]|uniref:Uncharacterized protein n=1 Tax=Vibrio phage pVco-5 TaxID=1965485 RepID=A0A1W6JV07_9CAUD|nr:hypothetical protein KNT61_gp120 [Vibrio phage pVco-5]ARM71108.1 hypothetical protein pVco5_119 [Vibrio phage pVco-5]